MYAVRSNETIRIYDSFAYRGSIKDMQDRFYDADDKCWVVPLTKENVATLGLLGATLDEELQALTVDKGIERTYRRQGTNTRKTAKCDHERNNGLLCDSDK